MSLRVLHLSTTDIQGGAARGSYWLHRALIADGADSRMLVDRKYSNDNTVIAPANGGPVIRKLRAIGERLPLRRYDTTGQQFWSTNWVPSRIGRAVRACKPDIVHVHWGGGGFLPVEAMPKLGKPVVWTLRDMWPFTGGCHYTDGCIRYRIGCGSCPQLRSTAEMDLSHRVFQRKLQSWRDGNIWLVPLSNWLADHARSSPLLGGNPMEVIPNGLDTDLFRPADPRIARRTWNLPADRKIILFGAINATKDVRKGYAHLRDAVRRLAADGASEDTMLVMFGTDGLDDADTLGMEVRTVGHIRDDERLAALYAAADVMVVPSLEEAFGKTLIEAMACGTPVVAFDSGGPADIVEHRRTGYLARSFEADDLAAGIAWCLERDGRPAELGRLSRKRVEDNYDIRVVARRYRDLYEQICGLDSSRRAA